MQCIKKIGLLLFGILLLMPAQSQEIFTGELDKLARKYVKKKKNKALIIGVIINGNYYVKGYGELGKNQPQAPTAQTLFEIGTLSSVFPATLMVQMAYEGDLNTAIPIRQLLPESLTFPAFQPQICTEVVINLNQREGYPLYPKRAISCKDDPLASPVDPTLCDLATHSSGLPNQLGKQQYAWHPFYSMNFKAERINDWEKLQFYNRLEQAPIMDHPGIKYRFSTAGIALLGQLLADQKGLSYADLLRSRITERLNMPQTRAELNREQKVHLAPGHTAKGKPACCWSFDALEPAVGLKSSTADLLSFLVANLNTKDPYWSPIFEQTHQPYLGMRRQKLGKPTWAGYGWLSSTLSKESNLPVVWMNGGTRGYSSFMGLQKDKQVAVVVLSNSANSVDEMSFKILEILIDRERLLMETAAIDKDQSSF
ncbi:MAG: serine hydrolase [Bacteroidota bacterium]